jgi:hypothetical protein
MLQRVIDVLVQLGGRRPAVPDRLGDHVPVDAIVQRQLESWPIKRRPYDGRPARCKWCRVTVVRVASSPVGSCRSMGCCWGCRAPTLNVCAPTAVGSLASCRLGCHFLRRHRPRSCTVSPWQAGETSSLPRRLHQRAGAQPHQRGGLYAVACNCWRSSIEQALAQVLVIAAPTLRPERHRRGRRSDCAGMSCGRAHDSASSPDGIRLSAATIGARGLTAARW